MVCVNMMRHDLVKFWGEKNLYLDSIVTILVFLFSRAHRHLLPCFVAYYAYFVYYSVSFSLYDHH